MAEDFVYELFETAMKETIFAVPCPADCRTGRALVGKLYLADKRGIDFDFLSAELPPAFPVKGNLFLISCLGVPFYIAAVIRFFNSYNSTNRDLE